MWTTPFIVLAFLLFSGSLERSQAQQIHALLEDLRSADVDTRLRAVKSLGESGDIRAVPPLLAVAYGEHGLMHQYAVEALQNLARMLDDAHGVVKRWLQSLIDALRSSPGEDRITVMRQGAGGLTEAAGKAPNADGNGAPLRRPGSLDLYGERA